MLENKIYNKYYFGIVVEIMVLAIFLLLSTGIVEAQTNTIFIRDDATGGNCTLIGTWDSSTKTCTLTTDLDRTIQIDNDGITLNGNGHIITGDGMGYGVYLYYRSNVTIKNLTAEKFASGIYLSFSSYNNLIENTILDNEDGIMLGGSDYNNIINNTASNNSRGISLNFPPGRENNLTGNIVKNNRRGISIRGHSNNFTDNTVSNNSEGFILYYSGNNTLKNNIISYNSYTGIFSDWGSVNNKFTSNTISDNPGSGLIVRYGNNNSLTENTVSNNSVGIIIASENQYTIFNNYFNNSDNVQIFFNVSGIWNITKQPETNIIGGPYLGGNFWAYPNGTGFSQTCPDNNKDGLCDVQYTLNEYNIDYLPLAPAAEAATNNLIINPGFESGTSPWIFYTNGTGKFTSASPGYEGSKSANIVLYTGGTNIQLYQKGISLEPETRYRLSFAAYSTTGHDLRVQLIKHISPYTNYGLGQNFNLGTSWQEFSTEFTTTGFIDPVNDGRLMFWLAPFAKAGDTYYIDNVRLEKI